MSPVFLSFQGFFLVCLWFLDLIVETTMSNLHTSSVYFQVLHLPKVNLSLFISSWGKKPCLTVFIKLQSKPICNYAILWIILLIMFKTYEKGGKTLEGCAGGRLTVGELTRIYLCGQWYLTTGFSFLPPSSPKQQLSSPCLGTHAQKPFLWSCSRMDSKTKCNSDCHKNSRAHSRMAEELVLASEVLKNHSGLVLMGAPPAFLRFEFDLYCLWIMAINLVWICQSFYCDFHSFQCCVLVSIGWSVFHHPLESAQVLVSSWWKPRLSSTTAMTMNICGSSCGRQNGLIQSPRIYHHAGRSSCSICEQ